MNIEINENDIGILLNAITYYKESLLSLKDNIFITDDVKIKMENERNKIDDISKLFHGYV